MFEMEYCNPFPMVFLPVSTVKLLIIFILADIVLRVGNIKFRKYSLFVLLLIVTTLNAIQKPISV
jgi:hypothetical protein